MNARAPATGDTLVEVRRVTKKYTISKGTFARRKVGETLAVDEVSFDIPRGQTLGMVGESGSGKSTIGRLILGLQQPTNGDVWFEGTALTRLSPAEFRPWRRHLQIVFQDPLSTLNPRRTVGESIARPLLNFGASRSQAMARAAELLDLVGINAAYANRYPHQFSGGQCQRIGIARALALEPSFLFLDEPISALDVSVQAQILNLLSDIRDRLGLTYLFVSHDLKIVRHFCDRMVVLYRGRVVEIGSAETVYGNPKHPYTRALRAGARGETPGEPAAGGDLDADAGAPSSSAKSCPFAPRCPDRMARCETERPLLTEAGEGHRVACHLHTPAFAGAGPSHRKGE